jgi:protein TonB
MNFLFLFVEKSAEGRQLLLPFKKRCEYPLMAFFSLLPVILFHVAVIWLLFVSVTKNVNKKPEVIEVSMMSVSNAQEKQDSQPKQPMPPPPSPPQPQKEAIKPKPVIKKIQPVKPPVPFKKVVEKNELPVIKEMTSVVDNTPPAPSPPPSPAPVSKTIETPPPRQISSGISPLFHVLPKYPQHAANSHIEGWVRVEFTIQTDGSVDDAVVVSSQPPDVFDDAALTAIRKWEFKEKIVNGIPVTQRATQILQFKLEN